MLLELDFVIIGDGVCVYLFFGIGRLSTPISKRYGTVLMML